MQEKKFLITLSTIFPIKDKISTPEREPVPKPVSESAIEPVPNQKVFDTPKTKREISPWKFHEKLLNEIKNEEKI